MFVEDSLVTTIDASNILGALVVKRSTIYQCWTREKATCYAPMGYDAINPKYFEDYDLWYHPKKKKKRLDV